MGLEAEPLQTENTSMAARTFLLTLRIFTAYITGLAMILRNTSDDV